MQAPDFNGLGWFFIIIGIILGILGMLIISYLFSHLTIGWR